MNTSKVEGVKTKVCFSCKIEKPVGLFSKNKAIKDGLDFYCKVCKKEYRKEYQKVNFDKIKDYKKEYRKANCTKINEYKKGWDKVNCDKTKWHQKKWTSKNIDKINSYSAKRRSKKLQATPPWLTMEHLSAIRDFYTESKALEKATGIKHHVDHIVPLQGKNVCGLHVPWNLNVLTATENLVKNSHYPNEWEAT